MTAEERREEQQRRLREMKENRAASAKTMSGMVTDVSLSANEIAYVDRVGLIRRPQAGFLETWRELLDRATFLDVWLRRESAVVDALAAKLEDTLRAAHNPSTRTLMDLLGKMMAEGGISPRMHTLPSASLLRMIALNQDYIERRTRLCGECWTKGYATFQAPGGLVIPTDPVREPAASAQRLGSVAVEYAVIGVMVAANGALSPVPRTFPVQIDNERREMSIRDQDDLMVGAASAKNKDVVLWNQQAVAKLGMTVLQHIANEVGTIMYQRRWWT